MKSAAEADKAAFLYHVGDVVYFNGQSGLYGAQFYEPYSTIPLDLHSRQSRR